MIPVVDGLLSEPYNAQLLVLLYRLAEWHALAKLRMHTEHSLQGLDKATTGIGCELRSFREWSRDSFTVKKLPSESDARRRRTRRIRAAQGGSSSYPEAVMNPSTAMSNSSLSRSSVVARTSITATNNAAAGSTSSEAPSTSTPTVGASATKTDTLKSSPKVEILNLFTYKLHALGDYVHTIRAFGTTDSFSTQIVCCFT